jgi:TorA maturation chaperone TorD
MQTVDVAPLHDYLKARQNFYRFLQLLFFEPFTPETISQLKKDGNLQELQALDQAGQYLHQFFEQVTENQLQLEKDEFNRLFVGPGPIVAPPWESVYTSKERLLFDKTTYQVREQYHHFGLQFHGENNEPDDHLVIELDFIIFLNDLCLNESDSVKLAELFDYQINFLDLHLTQWVPTFCGKIIKNTDSFLYKGAALLLQDFIESESESLTEMKEALADVR